MKYRLLGKTGWRVSEISLGTWQIGGKWGEAFDFKNAEQTLSTAVERGVNFIDTADVYGEGGSEKAIGRFLKNQTEEIHFATKCGRRLNPHVSEGYNRQNITRFVEDSLKNMDVEALDLLQLHCPPTEVYTRAEVFEALDELKAAGKILHYGVSVEKVEEALMAIEQPGVETVQIIFNMFRLKPGERFFPQAKKKNIGIIVRVPLASGLLSGKFTRDTAFGKNDHRFFNRSGEQFDKGETFSGVNYETGIEAVEELKEFFPPDGGSMAQYALRWILMSDAVSCIIPGASRPEQAADNAAASDLPPLTEKQMEKVRAVYDTYIRPQVHHLW